MATIDQEERAREAFGRWKASARTRQAANRKKERGELPDTPDRIVRHANRLRDQVQELMQSMADAERQLLPREVLSLAESEEITETSPALERVIGKSKDFLSAEFFELGVHAMRSVGRITSDHDGGRYYGTGFMVSPDLLLTNHHVFENAGWAEASYVEFDYQLDKAGRRKQVQEFVFDPARFFINDKKLDFALVAVKPRPTRGNGKLSDFGFCPLVGTVGKVLIKDPVNIIQHPAGRLKEVVIRENSLEAFPDEDGLFAQYIADTEGGSSGSPVFNDRWEVIALHHLSVPNMNESGQWLAKDGSVWRAAMGDDEVDWIGNEGIRISAIVRHLSELDVPEHMKPLLAELLDRSTSSEIGPVIAAPVDEVGSASAGGGAGDFDEPPSRTVVLPLTIVVELDGGRPQVRVGGGGYDGRENARPAADYDRRPGFDPEFLDASVPMPSVVDDSRGKLLKWNGNSHELKYHHYSVIMNSDRRLAYVSGVNFKANAPYYEARGKDRWFYDPRIDRGLQADNRFYVDNDLDRGHLTRRYDAGWGDTEAEAAAANDDTFHWTNCSPQHEVFNQSKLSQPRDLRLWGELENHVTAEARRDAPLLSIFNGPVFGDNDRTHRGLAIPADYWKIIAFRSRNDGNKLRAVGFIINQGAQIADLPSERAREFSAGKFNVWQVRISRIEELTGLEFGRLRNADPMAARGAREMESAERRLNSLSDVRL